MTLKIKLRRSGANAAPLEASGMRVRKLQHPMRPLVALVAVVLLAQAINSAVGNRGFHWTVVGHYMVSGPIIHGLFLTLELTAAAMGIGIVFGTVIALFRMSGNPLLRRFAWIYVWVFRGTPTLVQLIFFYNLSALYPHLSIGIPFGPTFATGRTNDLIAPMTAGILGLGLNEAAYMSEIIRSGLLAIDRGQTEAAKGLGMTPATTFRRIILPQAMRIVVPPTFNNIIGMLKYTSLVSVLSIGDLLYTSEQIYSVNFQPIPLLLVASIWYLAVTSVLMVGQHYIERALAGGSRRNAAVTGEDDDLAVRGPTALYVAEGQDAR
jgi:amine acid ABC transporter, permease protein, 3-TM region, His/Glu/Gln/Arg/opine family